MFVRSALQNFFLTILSGMCAITLCHKAAVAQNPDRLLPSIRLQKGIGAGETHTYEFEALAKQYVRFEINRTTVNLMISVTQPNQRQGNIFDCQRSDSTSLSLFASEKGVYRFVVKSVERNAVAGRYEMVLAEIRKAMPNDQKRLAAEQALREGDQLQADWTKTSLQRALEKYRLSLHYWLALGERAGQSRALRAMGDVYRAVGELKNARDSYTRAYQLATNAPRLKAGAAIGLGYVENILGDPLKGITYGSEAQALSQEVGDRAGEARALFCIGDAFDFNDKAAAYFQTALQIVNDSDDIPGQAQAYSELGYASAITPEKQPQALQFQEKALTLWRRLGDKRGQATTLIALGHLSSLTGNKQLALAFYHEAEPTITLCGEADNQARLYAGLGFVHEGLGDQQTALNYYLKALAKWRVSQFRNAEVQALTQIGRIYHETGENTQALSYLFQAKRMAQSLNNLSTEAWVSAHLGAVFSSLSREKEAFTAYQEALNEKANALPWIRTLALNGTGALYQRRGEYEEALNWYHRALALCLTSHEPFGEVSTLNNIARAERDSGNLKKALDTLLVAANKIEALRTKMAGQSMRASYFAATREAYETTIDIQMQLSQTGENQDFVKSAFEWSERARARSLLDVLVESKTELASENDPKLVADQRQLLAHISEKNRELAQMYASSTAPAQINTAEKELDDLVKRHGVVQSLMRAANPRYASLTQPEPSKLVEIQQLLDPETLLLEYSLGDDRSYLWTVAADSISSFQLPPQAEIEKVARQVYELLSAPNKIVKGESDILREARLKRAESEYPKAAFRLSQMILAPAASLLGTKRLVIVADGALQYIPFAALPIVKSSGSKSSLQTSSDFHPLLEDHEIINLPSASTLAAIRRERQSRKPAPRAVVVIADPVFNKEDASLRAAELQQTRGMSRQTRAADLQRAFRQLDKEGKQIALDRLLFSREEAMAILGIAPQGESVGLLDFQANRETVTQTDLHQYRIIHFATHGLLNSENPELSGIVLSLIDKDGKPQNGFLRLHEIYNLRLPAELVVLSACQTALGKEIRGEGIMGLTRGFMYAGASRVVASLWSVNDAATADLMGIFYKRMLQNGKRPAEALRDAQLKMKQQKQWQSPYHWAAFTIQGEWK
jgi:CHAT domain-containing protein